MTAFLAQTDWNRVLKKCTALLRAVPAPLQDKEDALADVVRDTLHACTDEQAFASEQHIRMYLVRAARCRLVDMYRRRRRTGDHSEYEENGEGTSATNVHFPHDETLPGIRIDLERAMHSLSPLQVRLVRLSMDGFTAREIEQLLLDEAAARRRRDGVDDWLNENVLSRSNGGGSSKAAAKNKTQVALALARL
jgi:DNA-directed RNA polymerase specialized sigma24 family protein